MTGYVKLQRRSLAERVIRFPYVFVKGYLLMRKCNNKFLESTISSWRLSLLTIKNYKQEIKE